MPFRCDGEFFLVMKNEMATHLKSYNPLPSSQKMLVFSAVQQRSLLDIHLRVTSFSFLCKLGAFLHFQFYSRVWFDILAVSKTLVRFIKR